ncbi:MAG: TIGR03621 family F420-dependent LLM class oxidoreductase [Chloroflexota bacterium]|nr:TIGR03621 family F420-dependent LLM class oxidoreductase [Chloroflexota bacterium]
MLRPRRFRFGVRTGTTSLWEWQEIARKSEAVGFDTLVAQDRFGKQFSPVPALVAAGAVTVRLRLGTMVLDNDLRHPAALAKEAATVDVMTSGRLELGLGAGWPQSEYDRIGLALHAPSERLERLSESVQICKLFFTCADETFSFAGKHYRLEQLDASPRPTRKPRPPILLAGHQRSMLALAGREADIVGISLPERPVEGQPTPTFAEKLEWVREAAGDRFGDLEIQVNASHVDVTDDRQAAIDQMVLRTGQSPAEIQASPGTLVGSVESIVEQLHASRERYGVSYYVVHARFMDAFAPILARVNGS